jgi:hypothetical protein
MFAALGRYPALSGWRGRGKDDLGLMLLEMWAYVCDVVSFYDEVIAHESYLRTARLRPSLRKLVDILGYVPKPPIAAQVALALLADGNRPVQVAAGCAFRSGAFGSNPPQVFETDGIAVIHPALNSMAVRQVYPSHLSAGQYTSFLLDEKGLKARQDDILLFLSPSLTAVGEVASISSHVGKDGTTYKSLTLGSPLNLNASTALSALKLLVPTAKGSLWRFATAGGDNPTIRVVGNGTEIYLDGQYPQIRTSDYVFLAQDGDIRWFKVTSVAGVMRKLITGLTSPLFDGNGDPAGTVSSPDIGVPVTRLTLDGAVNSRKRRAGLPDWTAADAPNLTLHYGFIPAGRITVEAKTSLSQSDPLIVAVPRLYPGVSPGTFLIEDSQEKGLLAGGRLDTTTGVVQTDQATEWDTPLMSPLTIRGNVVMATRGETVRGEVLGFGDASRETQRFKLKKKPLTYVPVAAPGNERGLKNTLKIFVNGVQWSEASSFFGAAPDAQIYILRQNDEGETEVIFGGGARPATGAPIVADYRHGAGAATPPAGSIHQLAKPVPGLKGVKNPVPAYGGDDAEAPSRLSQYGPCSALLLGRVVSIQDMEAAAVTVSGVRAVSAEWRWNDERQQPVAQVTYIGDSALKDVISQKLLSLADPTAPIDVKRALPTPSTLSLHVEVDQRLSEVSVVSQVLAALMDPERGMLSPERIGISKPLFRSRIFEKVLSVGGVLAVRQLTCNDVPFSQSALIPSPGRYFDFEQGTVQVNGVFYE